MSDWSFPSPFPVGEFEGDAEGRPFTISARRQARRSSQPRSILADDRPPELIFEVSLPLRSAFPERLILKADTGSFLADFPLETLWQRIPRLELSAGGLRAYGKPAETAAALERAGVAELVDWLRGLNTFVNVEEQAATVKFLALPESEAPRRAVEGLLRLARAFETLG